MFETRDGKRRKKMTWTIKKKEITYVLGGEDLCAAGVAPTARGLPLPDRGAGAFGFEEDGGGGGGTAAVRCVLGDDVEAGAAVLAETSEP